ncbi:DUF3196 family protein [Mesoplasma seiffertii]|uniref:DUF3196 family protein n=1 Tax=Mesoplasma seiffertii TaxID=28224 RepID=UPI000479C82C|nr:DUF3196 family protein [Mesoplasma seiffertii]
MNFYEEIIIEITELIDKKDYDQAMSIINQELSMPYVPAEVELKLLQLKKQIIDLSDDLIKRSGAQTFSIEDIQAMLNNDKDTIAQTIAINNIEKINIRLILEDIKKYLLNPQVVAQNKTFLLLALLKQDFNMDLQVFKNGEYFTINPASLSIEKIDQEIQTITNIVDQSLGQENPSLAEIATTALFLYFFNSFPKVELEQPYEAAAAIIYLAYEMSGLEFKIEEVAKWFEIDLEVANQYVQQIKESGALENATN